MKINFLQLLCPLWLLQNIVVDLLATRITYNEDKTFFEN